MSDPSATPDADEHLLAEFVTALEKQGKGAIDEYAHRYPQLAARIREIVRMRDAIADTAVQDDLTPLKRLGDFRIVRQLGGGGMGEVYEAVQEPLNRRVAVKIIRRGRVSPQARERFLREQQVLARLHQTHIVPIHVAGAEGSLQYFVMPFITGAALHHLIETARRLGCLQPGGKTYTLGQLAGLVAAEERGAAGEPDAPGTAEDYFRSAAGVMADAAEAVQHAHDAHVLHRDLKPSNLMVDTVGQCWLIDFGLAGYLDAPSAGPPAGRHVESEPESLTSTGILGTPEYMAPEQERGEADARTDVWGLGVTLYELLTLRRAFPVPGEAEPPIPPRKRESSVPADLEAICLKSIHREPGQRYQAVGEFAADLRRWLGHEPVRARPAWPFRRFWLWSRRNQGWAAALLFAFLVVVTLAGAGMLLEKTRADAAEDNSRELRRDSLMQRLEGLRAAPHAAGWSDQTWELVHQVAALRPDADLRDEAASTLVGIDAQLIRKFPKPAAIFLAFDPSGERILIEGEGDGGIWLAEMGSGRLQRCCGDGPGPVAFAGDGTPLHLTAPDPWSLVLWDLAQKRPVREFRLASPAGQPGKESPALALTPDGSLAALSTTLPSGRHALAVWDVRTRASLLRADVPVRVLAFSPGGEFLAGGDPDGKITLWPLRRPATAVPLNAGRTAIGCLAFMRNSRRGAKPNAENENWLLAAGDAGGTVTIWDLGLNGPPTRCRGSAYGVHALAFSPDGMTLASAGRDEAKLWDVATGRLLLNVGGRNTMRSLAFSPDGKRLAVGSIPAHGDKGGVDVWQLDNGRGLRLLRGLSGQVEKVVFSRDGRLLAALAHDWDLAVWDLEAGRLQHIFEAPKGFFADNAGFAFDADGNRLAFAAGSEARLWSLNTGELLQSWSLPSGFQDQVAFHPSGKLLLFRVETADEKTSPAGGRSQPPLVCRIRNLFDPIPLKPLAQIHSFSHHVDLAAAAPDGAYFVADGVGEPEGKHRTVRAFDGITGVELWSKDSRREEPQSHFAVDPTGQFLALALEGDETALMVEMPGGKPLGYLESFRLTLGPGANYRSQWDRYPPFRYVLYGKDRHIPLLNLKVNQPRSSILSSFDVAGRRFAWGNPDGSVTVCDLETVHRRLESVGLAWD